MGYKLKDNKPTDLNHDYGHEPKVIPKDKVNKALPMGSY